MVIESPKFHFDYEAHPFICSETADRVRWWLPVIPPSRPGAMPYKAPGTADRASSRRENDFAEEANSLAKDLVAHRGKSLNEKQERFLLRSARGQPLRWEGSTKVEGERHHAAVAETQHPGHPLGLRFDNILNFLLVLIYWLFSPENSWDC